MKKKELLKRIKALEERMNFFYQLVCKHIRCEIRHTTQGHWRVNEYVGGDIYTLWCKECQMKLDEVSNRWDTEWNEIELAKLNKWKYKFGEPK